MRVKMDLDEIASLLDDTIEKGLKNDLKKAISLDPMVVGPDSPFAEHYKWTPEGGFIPYEASYWETKGKPIDGYRTTQEFYDKYVYLTKGLKQLSTDLQKGNLDKVLTSPKTVQPYDVSISFTTQDGTERECVIKSIRAESEKDATHKIKKGLTDMYGQIEVTRIRIETHED